MDTDIITAVKLFIVRAQCFINVNLNCWPLFFIGKLRRKCLWSSYISLAEKLKRIKVLFFFVAWSVDMFIDVASIFCGQSQWSTRILLRLCKLHPHTQMYYIRKTKTNIVACFFEARVMKNVLINMDIRGLCSVPFYRRN